MVVEYEDIYESARKQIPEQDWSGPEWTARQDGTSIQVYKQNWNNEHGEGIYFHSYGQGDDPEQNPIILEIVFGEDIQNSVERKEELRERIGEDMKSLIGWEDSEDKSIFLRKELPSDPLTLLPRILEELKKLEIIGQRIDEMLAEQSQPA